MGVRKIKVAFMVTAELEIDEEVLAVAQTDEWRKTFYDFSTDEEVANHIAFNILKGSGLRMLDGFADRRDVDAVMRNVSWDPCDA